jgi:predicted  nucleic acid-binding Zn-ribbon protein
MSNLHIYKRVEEVLANPENYEQCIACKNAVDKRHKVDGCPTCGGHYFEPEKEKDFSHLKDLLPPNEEIEV